MKIQLDILILQFRDKTNGKAFGGLFQKISKDSELLNELEQRTLFLNSQYDFVSPQQRFYHIWFQQELEQCPYCSKPKRFSNIFSIIKYRVPGTKNYTNYYGTCDFINCKNQYLKDRTKESIKAKYGVDNISQTKEWHDKIKVSNLEKYGTEWQTQSENFKMKSEETWMENYGVKHHTQSDSSKNKKKETCIERYGVSHVLHDPEIYKRSSTNQYKLKEFIFPSGRIDKVQGYEPSALHELLIGGFMEDDIITDDKEIESFIGKIYYFDGKGIQHRYYPDIFIKSLNKVIEVKSEYTMRCNVLKNKMKKDATEALGLLFEYKIYKS
jgi:hypothetical protein